jgi:hypothetical protein
LLNFLDLEDVRGRITRETRCRELRDIPSLCAAYTAGTFEKKKTSGVVVPCLCDEAEYVLVHEDGYIVCRLGCYVRRVYNACGESDGTVLQGYYLTRKTSRGRGSTMHCLRVVSGLSRRTIWSVCSP